MEEKESELDIEEILKKNVALNKERIEKMGR